VGPDQEERIGSTSLHTHTQTDSATNKHTNTAGGCCRVEHFNSRFESIRFVKKSAFRFTSCHAVFLAYLFYSLSQKNTPQCTQLKATLCRTSTKNSYAMHTTKITPNLLFEYQCTSGKFIRLPNRIESNRNFFCPNWNALLSCGGRTGVT